MSDAVKLLVVDDDASIRQGLCDYLSGHGFAVGLAANGAEMDRAFGAGPIDLIVLDVMMPGEDGLSICRRLRSGGTPVLMLSALGETTDRIVGLEMGADDYLAKPFEPRELLARIRALLRRRENPHACGSVRQFAGWRLDMATSRLTDPTGTNVILTSGEMALLRAFLERPRQVLSRNQLIDAARGINSDIYDRAIDLQVSRLRRKLAPGGGETLIETIRGEGYIFTVPAHRV